MPTAAQICGEFWDESYTSDVVDSYVTVAFALSEFATRISPGKLSAWTLNQSELVLGNVGSRIVYGYPAPENFPLWIAADMIGEGPIVAYRVDYDVSNAMVWFDEDPFQWAENKFLTWINGAPVNAVSLFYSSTPLPDPPPTDPSTWLAFTSAIATACDSPAAVGNETVQAIWQGQDAIWRVITDQNCYRTSPLDVPSIIVGEELLPGQPIGTSWTLTQLGPALPDLAYVTTPASYQQGVTVGGITYYNVTVTTSVTTVGGRTQITWPLGGTQTDVNDYWAASQATGILPGNITLAQAMDLRTNPVGDPTVHSLPTTVNPLAFVCAQLFAGNAYYLLVLPERCGPLALTDAARQTLVQQAAGPYAAVFEYLDTMPALPQVAPN